MKCVILRSAVGNDLEVGKMATNFGITYAVDIVFCIDSTASMRPVIDMVKDQAIHLYDDLMRVMESKNKKIDRMRIKVISF